MRGVERRIEAGLDPAVPSVASIFVSRWDVAVADQVPPELRNRLGIAVATQAYRAYRELLDSERWQRLANEGARPQRLLFASTGTKDPDASDALYVEALAAPFTINTMPDKTLLAFADHGEVGDPLPADGGDAEQVLAEFEAAGVDVAELAARLQREGAEAFDKSWNELHAVDRREEPQARRDRMSRARSAREPAAQPAERSPGNATRNDRTGAHGRQHGAPPAARRTTSAWSSTSTPTPCRSSRARAPWAPSPSRTWWPSSTPPRSVWLMVPAAVVDKTLDGLVPALESGRRRDRRRELLLPGRHPTRRRGWPSTTSTTSTPGRAAASGGSTAATA